MPQPNDSLQATLLKVAESMEKLASSLEAQQNEKTAANDTINDYGTIDTKPSQGSDDFISFCLSGY